MKIIRKIGTGVIVCIMFMLLSAISAGAYNFFANYPSYPANPKTTNPRILMVGNSLTYYNNVPNLLANMCKNTGINATVDSVTQGGHSLTQYVFPSTETEKKLNQTLMNKLTTQHWDYVILQGRSDETIYKKDTMASAIAKLYPLIKNSGAQMVLYLTWAPEYTTPGYDMDVRQGQIADVYYGFAKQYHCALAPSGIAFARTKKLYPDWDLHYSKTDRLHANIMGSYLSACCIYGTLFGKSPENLAYTANIPMDKAKVLQGIAADLTVRNQNKNDSLQNVVCQSNAKGYFMKPGEKKVLQYTCTAGTGRIIRYISSDESVVAVDSTGTLKAKKCGTAQVIIYLNNNQRLDWNVIVSEKQKVTLGAGDSQTLDFNTKGISWKTTDDDTAVVKNGKIQAKNPGTATLTGTQKNGFDIVLKVTVKKAPTKLNVKNAPEKMLAGKTLKLKLNVSGVKVVYKSSKSSVVSVSKTGVLTAKKPGTAKITVKTYNGISKSFKVKVCVPTQKIQIRNVKSGAVLKLGQSIKLKLKFTPSNVSDKTVTYKSSNKKVVMVDKNGKIKAIKKGTAKITVTAKDGSKKKSVITIKVN